MINGEIGWPSVEVRPIAELACLWYRIPVAGDERAIRICLAGIRVRYDRRNPDEAVRGIAKRREPDPEARLHVANQAGTQEIIDGMRVRVIRFNQEPPAHLLAETYDNRVVTAAVPRAIAVDRLVSSSG